MSIREQACLEVEKQQISRKYDLIDSHLATIAREKKTLELQLLDQENAFKVKDILTNHSTESYTWNYGKRVHYTHWENKKNF